MGLLKLLLSGGFSFGLLHIFFQIYAFSLNEPLTTSVLTTTAFTNVSIPCHANEYPRTHYRRRFQYRNDSWFSVFAINIGEMIAALVGDQHEIYTWSSVLHSDLLYLKDDHTDHDFNSSKHKLSAELYDVLFNLTSDPIHSMCTGMPFFEFIHFDAPKINNSAEAAINFYDMMPIKADDLSSSEHMHGNLTDTYYLPALYEYVLTVDDDGYLPSVQLRFAEISSAGQSDLVKHKELNRNEKQVLWAGEFYVVYDYSYRNYVAIFDTASGHWKPKKDEFPQYLRSMLLRALFPRCNASAAQDGFYQPFIMVGHDEQPWCDYKRTLCPVIQRIERFRERRNVVRKLGMRKKERQHEKKHFIEAQRMGPH